MSKSESVTTPGQRCVELVDTNPTGLGRYIASTTRQCRNKGTVQTKRGLLCKFHARKVLALAGDGGETKGEGDQVA